MNKLGRRTPTLKALKHKAFVAPTMGTAAASSIGPSAPDGQAPCQVLIDPVRGSAVTGHFMGKLHPGVDVEFRVHMCEMGLYRPPGNE